MWIRKVIILLLLSLVGFEMPRQTTIPDNSVGVWQVPSIETSTPLYAGKQSAQSIVDEENSAWIGDYGNGRIITDHAGSTVGGVWDVNQIKVGDTAFLIDRDKTTQYECIAVWKAKYHPTYYSFQGLGLYPRSSLDIMCVSCADDTGEEVYIAYFKYAGTLP